MATQNFTFYLYQTPHGSLDEPSFVLTSSEGMDVHGWVLMRKEIVCVELPEPQDVRQIKLRHIDIEEQKARAAFAARVTQLQRERQELLAIENTVEA